MDYKTLDIAEDRLREVNSTEFVVRVRVDMEVKNAIQNEGMV